VLLVDRILAATCLVIILVAFSAAQEATSKGDFVIDENRQYVYLLFDHMGKGPRFADGEPATRIWFKLVNNCRIPIRVRTFGTPKGSLDGEVGVLHDVVRDEKGITVTSDLEPTRNTKGEPKMPTGYVAEVSSAATIAPNDSLLFSVPTTHLNYSWHIEIPYEFRVPTGKCCRSENVGGEPKMVLRYSIWDLPADVKRELRAER
jgi:hypothetical protein